MAVSLQGNHLSIASPVFRAFGCSTMVSLISFLRRIAWGTLTSARDLDGNIPQIRRGASEIEKIETNYIRIPSLGMMVCNCVTILEIKQIETTIKYTHFFDDYSILIGINTIWSFRSLFDHFSNNRRVSHGSFCRPIATVPGAHYAQPYTERKTGKTESRLCVVGKIPDNSGNKGWSTTRTN